MLHCTGSDRYCTALQLELLHCAVAVSTFHEWLGMQAVQVLDVSCDLFMLGLQMLDLVTSERWRQVNMVGGHSYDNVCTVPLQLLYVV